MKTKIVFLILIVLIAGTGNGLMASGVGFKAGLQLSKIDTDFSFLGLENTPIENNFQLNIQAGLFIRLEVSKRFSIQPELYYSRKGTNGEYFSSYERSSTDGKITYFGTETGKYQIRTDYLELPILFNYHLIKQQRFGLTLYTGPYIGYKLSTNIKGTIHYHDQVNEEGVISGEITELDLYDDTAKKWLNPYVNKIDTGVIGGIGIDVKIPTGILFIDFRAAVGFKKIMQFDNSEDYSGKGISFSLLFGYAYH